MTSLSKFRKVIIASFVLIFTLPVQANTSKFKVVSIKNNTNKQSTFINHESTNRQKTQNQANDVQAAFNLSMMQCAAYLRNEEASKSSKACSAAVQHIELMDANTQQSRYLKSLSYSNRAIAKYSNNDESGALNDLVRAILIDSNAITRSNLTLMSSLLKNKAEDISPEYISLSD
ncbi:hypothetical protein [Litorilituus sediminis]|uniref:Uncharacterized protein n=1 Tax=Litorilituus sediminis TaxID=718192 RepID=A0A4V0ZG03_9GAMM|nr:hypothetical protein [Litorilituus sediminis]QBG35600.1 hypothetical protein EMK97_07680 [Litorilituus sediminis]